MTGRYLVFALTFLFIISLSIVFFFIDDKCDTARLAENTLAGEEIQISPVNTSLLDTDSHKADDVQINQSPVAAITQNSALVQNIDELKTSAEQFDCSLDYPSTSKNTARENEVYINSLATSSSPADRLKHALFAIAPEGSSKFELLYEHFQLDQSSPLLSKALLNLCAQSLDERCDQALIKRLVLVDRNNGSTWLPALAFYAKSGNESAFIEGVDELAKTSFFNERLGEWSMNYANALSGSEHSNFKADASTGLSLQPNVFRASLSIMDWCSQGLDIGNKADVCLRLGQQLTRRGNLTITYKMGWALQEVVFSHYGDQESLAAINEKYQTLVKIRTEYGLNIAESMIFSDESLMRQFLRNMDNLGDFEAGKLLLEENRQFVAKYRQACHAKANVNVNG